MSGITKQQSAKRARRKARERVTKVRMSEEEWALMDDCKLYGFYSKSDLMRWLVWQWYEGRQEFGTPPVPAEAARPVVPQPTADAKAIVDAVNKIGVNLNQVAAELNRRRKYDEAHPNDRKHKEPLDRQMWDYTFDALRGAEAAVLKANEHLMRIQGTAGTPDNFNVPKPLLRKDAES